MEFNESILFVDESDPFRDGSVVYIQIMAFCFMTILLGICFTLKFRCKGYGRDDEQDVGI